MQQGGSPPRLDGEEEEDVCRIANRLEEKGLEPRDWRVGMARLLEQSPAVEDSRCWQPVPSLLLNQNQESKPNRAHTWRKSCYTLKASPKGE